MAGTQVNSLLTQADISKDIADDLIEEYVHNQLAAVVRETCADYVQDFVQGGKPDDILNNLTDEIIRETCHSVFEELKEEALLDEHIIDPVVNDMLIDAAADALEHADSKLKAEEFKELSEDAQTKFLDGIVLDYVLEQIVRQEKVHVNDSTAANFTVDEMMVEILLERAIEIDYSLFQPMDVKPVQRYHERVVTDVVMDLLLNELCLNLDDDMKDFDEYELGLTDYLLSNGHYDD